MMSDLLYENFLISQHKLLTAVNFSCNTCFVVQYGRLVLGYIGVLSSSTCVPFFNK